MRRNMMALVMTAGLVCWMSVGTAMAHDPLNRVRVTSRFDFAGTVARLERAVAENGLAVVTRANAQNGARSLGIAVPGNQVWGIFAPRFAVRMLKVSTDAGIEAPLRVYLAEAADGGVTVAYIKPSAVFAPYASQDLDLMAGELDALFERIAQSVR